MARSGEGAGGGRRGRWMDRHTDPNRFAPSGVIKFFSQPLVQDKWPVKIHLS